MKNKVSAEKRPFPAPAALEREERSEQRLGGGGLPERTGVPADRVSILEYLLIALALPVILVVAAMVAVWIKLVSRGDVLFRQSRIGHFGRSFTIIKFRTMKEGASTEAHERHMAELVHSNLPMTKLDEKGDGRLIPGWAFLRITGIDELPQIINVLRGEMSLVGPRPCLPGEYELFSPAQRERFDVLPGLSGYWQVCGKNETTFTEMVALDLHYVRNRSSWLDLGLIILTPWAILGHTARSLRSRKNLIWRIWRTSP